MGTSPQPYLLLTYELLINVVAGSRWRIWWWTWTGTSHLYVLYDIFLLSEQRVSLISAYTQQAAAKSISRYMYLMPHNSRVMFPKRLDQT